MAYNKENDLWEGYIYCLTNMKSPTYKKYIGQTTTTIKHRLGQHYTAKKNYAIYNAFKKHGKENFKVEQICKIVAKTKEELIKKLNIEEKFCIDWYQTKCEQNGYNIDIGGAQVSYFCIPVDVYSVDGEFIKTFDSGADAERYYGIYGVSDMCRGIQGKNNKYQITFRYHGDPFDKYNPNTYKRSKTIYQFDLDGNLLNTFDNRTDALKYLNDKEGLNLKSLGIDEAVKNNTTAYGYTWSFDGEFRFDENNYRNNVKVKKYSIDGILLGSYKTMSEALINIGKEPYNSKNIKRSCDGETYYPTFGYVWRYENDDFDKYPIVLESKNTKKCIDQYTLNGEFVATYNTISEALIANKISIDYCSQVSECCRGKKSYIQGYVWRFHGEPFDLYPVNIIKPHFSTTINKYSLDNIFIDCFVSCKEAAESVELKNASPVSQCAKGKRKTAGGFKWFYANDPEQPDKTKILN
jgi:hypothetical protein